MSKLGEHEFYWEWCKFVVDFNDYADDKYHKNQFGHIEFNRDSDRYKLEYGFQYVGIPLKERFPNRWYNGGWSSEYNKALNYLIELGFIRKVDLNE